MSQREERNWERGSRGKGERKENRKKRDSSDR